MSSFVLTRKFLFFACLRDLRDKVLKRIKKALKSNQKQLDLRAMRHLDIILAKKLVSSICPQDDFGGPKNPYISRLFRIPWCSRAKQDILERANFLILSHSFISHLFCFAAHPFFFLIFSCFFLIHSWYRAALHDK